MFRIWKKQKKLKILYNMFYQMIFLFGILLTFYVNFLWSLKLDIFF